MTSRASGSQSAKRGAISSENVFRSISLDQDHEGQRVFSFERSVIDTAMFNIDLDIG
jgi:hypothetical protein